MALKTTEIFFFEFNIGISRILFEESKFLLSIKPTILNLFIFSDCKPFTTEIAFESAP